MFFLCVCGPNDKAKDSGNVEAISGDKFVSNWAQNWRVGLLLLTIVVCCDEKEIHEG